MQIKMELAGKQINSNNQITAALLSGNWFTRFSVQDPTKQSLFEFTLSLEETKSFLQDLSKFISESESNISRIKAHKLC